MFAVDGLPSILNVHMAGCCFSGYLSFFSSRPKIKKKYLSFFPRNFYFLFFQFFAELRDRKKKRDKH